MQKTLDAKVFLETESVSIPNLRIGDFVWRNGGSGIFRITSESKSHYDYKNGSLYYSIDADFYCDSTTDHKCFCRNHGGFQGASFTTFFKVTNIEAYIATYPQLLNK